MPGGRLADELADVEREREIDEMQDETDEEPRRFPEIPVWMAWVAGVVLGCALLVWEFVPG